MYVEWSTSYAELGILGGVLVPLPPPFVYVSSNISINVDESCRSPNLTYCSSGLRCPVSLSDHDQQTMVICTSLQSTVVGESIV